MKKKIGLITALLLVAALTVPLLGAVPVLAAPGVASVTETEFDTSATDHNVAMPATVATDDLLIVLFVNTHTSTVGTPGGWNLMSSNSTDSGATSPGDGVRFSVYYKKAAGTEGGTTVNFVTSSAERAAAQVYRISSYSWDTATPPEISAAATGTSNAPNPGSLNPTEWGTEETLWIAACGFGDDDGMSSYPSSYIDTRESRGSGTGADCELNSARRVNTTASEDPAFFDISGSDTEDWVAFTIAVRPAVVDCSSVKTQFAMILDGSGSIGSWSIIVNGLAAAVNNTECIPHDGSVELTVVQFSYDAALEIGPVVITEANADDVADAIRGIAQMRQNTCISCGFCLAADTLAASSCFNSSLKQVINLVTDGEPNECSCSGSTCGYSGDDGCGSLTDRQSAECARNYTLNLLGMTEDQDEIDAEFIGTQGSSSNWLRDSIVWPQPGYYLDPPAANWTGPGWVRVVADEQEFADTLCEKFQVIIEEEYSLTVVSDGCCPITVGTLGSVNASDSDTFTVPAGTNVTLTADDTDPCCVFDYWTGNVTGAPNSTNPITITMDGDKTVTATCHWLSYNLTVVSDGCCGITVGTQGTVDPGESDTFTVSCGTNVTLTASNSSSCGFVEWTVDGVPPANGSKTITVQMDANHTATAVCNATVIGDTVFYDNNNNGDQDPGEGGVAGVTVNLYKDDGDGGFEPGTDDQLVGTNTTSGDGKYAFTGVEAGCYWVLVDESTLPAGVTLPAGSNPYFVCPDPGEFRDDADFPALTQEIPPVGGEAYPINKFLILLPWIAFGAAIMAGLAMLARRRRAQS